MAVKKSSKVIKKKWFKIIAPSLLKEAVVGETFLANPEDIIGKKITTSLGNITGENQKQHTHVKLTVNSYQDGLFKTEIQGWKLLPSAMKKFVRRNRSRIDDSFVVITKDKKYVRVKPLIITRTKARRSIQTLIRQKIRAEIAKNFLQKDFNSIAEELLARRFQQGVNKKIAKLFPLTFFDLRNLSIVEEEKAKKMNIIQFIEEKKKDDKEEKEKFDEKK
jgi:small subunit ribosomal protein S3Ae